MRILRLARQLTQAALFSAGTVLMAGAAFAVLCSTAHAARTAQAPDDDAARTESPYFDVSGGAPGVDALPLKSTSVDVKILGPIADVTVTQHYRNEGSRPIEARYVFPGSTQAAVHAMTVRLGDRELVAKIKEAQAARADYDQARAEGRTAALLTQHRPNVFQMNVAHILPGDDVRVVLRYTELLVPKDGRYEFVFPTVVGPRYASGDAGAGFAVPYLPEGRASSARFDLNVDLLTPVAPKDIASPSHSIDIAPVAGDGKRVAVRLRAPQPPSNDRDFILGYGLSGDSIESGLLISKGTGDDENFFLAMVEPPKLVAPAAIVPREYVFVVDISGSMHGFPLDTAKTMLGQLLATLRPVDSFNVMLFSGSAQMLADASMPATPERIATTMSLLDRHMGSGGTEIVPALRRIAAMPKRDDVSRTVVVITDGYVTVEREVFEIVRRDLSGSNVFAFGIGSSVNRALIEGIARAGRGEAFVITQPGQAAAQASRFRRMIESPVLTQVKTRFEGLDVYDVEPLAANDVLGQRPVLVFGKWRGEPRGRLVVEGRQAEGPMRAELAVGSAVTGDAQALRHLWARERIAALSDEEALTGDQRRKAAITELGLRYGLLTNYTSFIAVDDRVRNTAGAQSVDQPSPLPQGLGATALGAPLPSTPEPGALASAALMLAALLLWGWRSQR